MWVAVALCVVGVIATCVAVTMDAHGVRQSGQADDVKEQQQSFSIWDVKLLTAEFWLINVTLLFLYCGFMPFVADSA